MVLVEDPPRLVHVQTVLGERLPRQIREPLEIGPHDAVLGRRGRDLFEAFELAHRLLVRLLRQARRLETLAQFGDLLLVVLAFTEFLADRVELLPEHVVALRPAHLGLDLLLDLGLDRVFLLLLAELRLHELQPCDDVELLEHRLLAREVEVEVCRDQVGETRRVVEVRREHLDLAVLPVGRFDELREALHDVACERLHLDALEVARLLFERPDACAQEGLFGGELLEGDTRDALHEQPIGIVGELEHLDDAQHCPDAVDVLGDRRVLDLVPDRRAHEQPVGPQQHLVDQLLRARGVDEQRGQQVREEHRVAQRQHGQFCGQGGNAVAEPVLFVTFVDVHLHLVARRRRRQRGRFVLQLFVAFAHPPSPARSTGMRRLSATRFGSTIRRKPFSRCALTRSR